jgi:hypothetical protein
MAILKKTTVVAKPAAKPVVKATIQKQTVSVNKKTGKTTKSPMSAPVAMKSKSITAKEFNTDKKAGYGAKQYRDDSVKVRKSFNTIDSIDNSQDGMYRDEKVQFYKPEDGVKRNAARDTLMAAGGRMMNYKKSKKK